jgi:hypothetical protein
MAAGSELTIFGKIAHDGPLDAPATLSHPTEPSGSLQMAQVFGYQLHGQCVRLASPVLMAVPDPIGPATECGWNPDDFVMWRVPGNWSTLLLAPHAGPAAHVLTMQAGAQPIMLDWQADRVAYDCVVRITGSSRPFNRSELLLQSGVNSDQQCEQIVGLIVSDPTVGVRRFGFMMPANALKDLASDWTMGQLSSRIQSSSIKP